jgi:hypothetical protein
MTVSGPLSFEQRMLRRRRREWEEEVRSSVHFRVLHYVLRGTACACSGHRCWLEGTAPLPLGWLHSGTSRHNRSTTCGGVTIYHTLHINIQLCTNNSINILYFNIDFKLLPKTWHFVFAYCFSVLCNIPSKISFLKIATIDGRSM